MFTTLKQTSQKEHGRKKCKITTRLIVIKYTTLHKKLKSLTGLNTTGFVRSIRLKAACRMMDENPNFRISELAYKVGFNDPKYFSICFKKEFGMQPTEYSMKSGKNA